MSFTLMLKILSTKLAKYKKSRVGVGGDGKNIHNGRVELNGRDKISSNKVDSNGVGDNEVVEEKNYQKMSKFKKTVRSLDFLISGAKLTFTKLGEAFIKALILDHFDLDCHIWIETDILGYAIGGLLIQLTLNSSGQ